jgi:hypothetical protein
MTIQSQSFEPNGFQSKATLPALAKAIAVWFPELQGRSLPVSDYHITRENVPTLPLVMLYLDREIGNCSVGTNRIEPEEQFMVEFRFAPMRYLTSTNSETPFWAFYDYDTLRDRFVSQLREWFTPRGERLDYFGMNVQSDQFATVITFQIRHKFVFCDPEPTVEMLGCDGRPMVFDLQLCQPSEYCEVLDEFIDPCEPK